MGMPFLTCLNYRVCLRGDDIPLISALKIFSDQSSSEHCTATAPTPTAVEAMPMVADTGRDSEEDQRQHRSPMNTQGFMMFLHPAPREAPCQGKKFL